MSKKSTAQTLTVEGLYRRLRIVAGVTVAGALAAIVAALEQDDRNLARILAIAGAFFAIGFLLCVPPIWSGLRKSDGSQSALKRYDRWLSLALACFVVTLVALVIFIVVTVLD